jgi:hypothetical protein
MLARAALVWSVTKFARELILRMIASIAIVRGEASKQLFETLEDWNARLENNILLGQRLPS